MICDWCVKELTHLVNYEGHIRSGQGKVLKSTNNVVKLNTIFLSQSCAALNQQLVRRCHRSHYSLALPHTNLIKQVHGIFFLAQQKTTILATRDLDAQEIMLVPKILQGKIRGQIPQKSINSSRTGTR
jgi:hypothetical protein